MQFSFIYLTSVKSIELNFIRTARPKPTTPKGPAPNVKNVTSKIGSLQNTSYTPGGGQVSTSGDERRGKKWWWKKGYKIDIKEGVCKIGRLEGVQKVPVFMICQQELEIVKFILKKTQKSLQIWKFDKKWWWKLLFLGVFCNRWELPQRRQTIPVSQVE